MIIPNNLSEEEYSYIDRSNFIIRFEMLSNYLEDHAIKTRQLRLLEVGCRDGLLAKFLKANEINNINCYGVDIDDDSLRKASQRGVVTRKCDLNFEEIPFEDNMFDFIIAFEVIEHIPFYHNVFSEMRRVLKDNGVLLLTTPNIASLGNRIRFLAGRDIHRVYTKDQKDVHFRMFTLESIEKLFLMHDFTIVYSTVLTSSKKQLSKNIKKLIPHLSDIVFCVGKKH